MARKVILIAGTGAGIAPWCEDPAHPFQLELNAAGLENARHPITRQFYRWSTDLSGLPLVHRGAWDDAAETLVTFAIETGAYDWICHSHGGQVAIKAAVLLRNIHRVRTLTDIATPVRSDVDAPRAVENINYWQHLYDPKRDWIATLRKLGQIGDGNLSWDRDFKVAGVINRPIDGMRHSRLLDERCVHLWRELDLFGPILARHDGDQC